MFRNIKRISKPMNPFWSLYIFLVLISGRFPKVVISEIGHYVIRALICYFQAFFVGVCQVIPTPIYYEDISKYEGENAVSQ